jgi:C-terminal domain 7 of the ABC-three component (ABC-3C) systems
MSNKFTDSASASAIGYIHQVLSYSLYLALHRQDSTDRTIFIERFDDIELCEGEDVIDSLQIKHVTTNLTNRSSDLWKTIRAWSKNYKDGLIQLPDSILTIITTAEAPAGSIASLLLRNGNRNSDKACELLIVETKKPTASLKKYFDAFNSLLPDQQRRLVRAIYIQDKAPKIDDIPSKIKTHFGAAQPHNHDDLYEKLTGWWQKQVIAHLRGGSETPIRVSAVYSKIADINDTLKEREIADPFFDESPPEDYDWDSRTFVRQMSVVKLPSSARQRAIRDQYRASKLRDWLVDEVHLTSLVEYDEMLKEEWELIFERIVGEYDLESISEGIAQKVGRDVYYDVQKIDIPISAKLAPKRYTTRGSFHILADKKDDLVVGWHPDFKEKLSSSE